MVRTGGDPALEQVLLGGAQFGPGFDAQFLGQSSADALELLQGRGLPAAGGQRGDDPAVQGLVERVALHGAAQHRQHFFGQLGCRRQDGVGRFLHRRDELVPHRGEHRVPGHMGAGGDDRTAPQPQRLHEVLCGLRRRAAPERELCLGAQVTEVQQVRGRGVDQQAVSVGGAHEVCRVRPAAQFGFECSAQRADVPVHHVDGAGRWLVVPQDVHGFVHREWAGGTQQQQGEQGQSLRGTKVDLGVTTRCPHGAED